MQAIEFEREARHRLPELLAALLDLPVADVSTANAVRKGVVDLEVHAGGRHWLAEVKAKSSPAMVARAAEKLAEVAHQSGAHRDDERIALLVVPYMTPAGSKAAAERNVSWVDLSGNASIRARDLFVHVEGRPNQFTRPGRPSTPFAPKSARITRVLLLDPNRWWRQKDLAAETGLDDGHVSRVVRRLDDDRLITYRAAALRPRDPELLLDAWADAYRFDRHDVVAAHVSGTGTELANEVGRLLEAGGVRHAFTGLPAAWAMSQHARYRLVSVYVQGDPRDALEAAGMRRGERGANVQVIGPDDDGVFAGAQDVNGLTCVSPAQAYLDLINLPERAKEAAERLRADHLLWPADA